VYIVFIVFQAIVRSVFKVSLFFFVCGGGDAFFFFL